MCFAPQASKVLGAKHVSNPVKQGVNHACHAWLIFQANCYCDPTHEKSQAGATLQHRGAFIACAGPGDNPQLSTTTSYTAAQSASSDTPDAGVAREGNGSAATAVDPTPARGIIIIETTTKRSAGRGGAAGEGGSVNLVPVIVGVIAAMLVVCLVVAWVLNHRRGRGSTHRVAKQMAALRELLLQNVQAQFLLGYRQLIGIDIASFEEYQAQIATFEVSASAIMIEDELGKGNYGTVFRAQLKRRGRPTVMVAVKVPNPPGLGAGADLESLADQSTALLLEAFVMHGLRHAFIVPVVALAAHCQPVMLCLELMENGDLRSFLRACRPSLPNPKAVIDTLTIAKMAARLSSAMSFLEKNRVIHRDLAARNVLVGATVLDVKLGDLGAARNVKNKEEYTFYSHHDAYAGKVDVSRVPARGQVLTQVGRFCVWGFAMGDLRPWKNTVGCVWSGRHCGRAEEWRAAAGAADDAGAHVRPMPSLLGINASGPPFICPDQRRTANSSRYCSKF